MNKNKIKTIELKSFRGATRPWQLDFDIKKSMALIFGENGTGKSTLVDAIDFIFNQECGSLKEKSSTNIKNHLPALGSAPADVEVSIRSQEGSSWTGRLNGSKPEIEGDRHLFSVGILRRDKILKLINAEPSKRYEALKDFIELPNIRSAENSLRDLIRNMRHDLDHEVRNKTDQESRLREIWEKEGKSGENFHNWAEEISKKEGAELKAKINKYEQFIDLIKKPFESWKEREKLRSQFSESTQKLNIIKSNLETLQEKNQPEEIIDILQKTQSFLQKEESAEKCPACEQPVVSENLQKRISERLKDMNKMVEAKEQYTKTNKNYELAKEHLSKKETELQRSAQKLIEHSKQETGIKESKYIIEIFNQNNFLAEGKFDAQKAEVFFNSLISFSETVQRKFETDKKTLNQLNFTKIAYLNLKKSEKKVNELNQKKEYLDQILKIIESERKSYVEDVLKRISQDIETLYLKLHPNEGLGGIRLFLKPQVKASLEIKSGFQNRENIPPQAYYSDSHLDTLGICVFIAMAKHFQNDIIILDDVVTSLDQQHLSRFIEMLHSESRNFNQTILTTHYRPWREKYKFSRNPSSNIQLIELSTFWSLEKGIKSSQTKFSIEELEYLKNQNSFDRQVAGSKAGVFLENLLDHLTLLYALNAPRKANSIYTLGELMNCFSNKFIEKMKVKKEGGNEIPLLDIINNLFQITEPIRNRVGSHWNVSGQELSDREVMSFLDQTIALGKMLICDQCKGLPQKKTSDSWKCACGQISLSPLSKK